MGYIVEQYADNRAGLVFAGNRNAIWHRLGEQALPDDNATTLAKKARMDFTVAKGRAFARVGNGELRETDRYFVYREDTGDVLSPVVVSDQYSLHGIQPIEVIDFSMRYVATDPRFTFSAAGMLDNGARLWATAQFKAGETLKIGGETHLAYLLMSTTYDASAPTTASLSITRAICDNTLAAALGDNRAMIKIRHNSKFHAETVAKDLASVAQGVETYKAVGDAMAAFEVSKEQASRFFRECLDIPFDAKIEGVSARKLNQFYALNDAYKTSVSEGAPKLSAWALLQGLTRYVDHDRATRNAGGNESTKRFQSAQFGSGAALKSQGMAILQGILKDAGKLPVTA
jgi:phage/plasmid-like protein (TIGR03299 family)